MTRFLTLGKTMNLRHMGGYTTASGRTTSAGHLFRSGFLHLPDADSVAGFSKLGVGTIYDFRSPMERGKNDLQVDPHIKVVQLGMLVASVENLWAMLLQEGLTAQGAEAIMRERYKELTEEEIPGYRAMFKDMVEGEGGVLVMCSFGKDRAGIASALVLAALGVPESTIREDYLLSSGAYADRNAAVQKFEQFFAAEGMPLAAEVVDPILDARAQYLDTAWEVMRNASGSLDNFMAEKLGMDREARDILIRRFTS